MKNFFVSKHKGLIDVEKKVTQLSLMDEATLLSDKQEVSKEEELLGDWVIVTNGGSDVITKLSSRDDDVTTKNVSAYTSDDAKEEVEPVMNKFKPIRLSDLQMYPPFSDTGRKMTGALEAHANGFRYSTSEEDDQERVVDIMLVNIKYAFFQPRLAEKSKYTLLHFHLHNDMVVCREKTKDLQFLIEVVDNDLDEINKNNMNFQNFANMVQGGLDLEFEQPQFELGFHGELSDRCTSPAFIVPTKSCLVELIGFPFLVITLSEIGIVNLERIRRAFREWDARDYKMKQREKMKKKQNKQRKYFDMAIVLKDMKRDVMVIRRIPPTSFVGIEEWMRTCCGGNGIKYHRSRLNLKWRDILDAFLDDPRVFVEAGGWDFLKKEEVCNSESDLENYIL